MTSAWTLGAPRSVRFVSYGYYFPVGYGPIYSA